jgi:hypothetical protein
MIVFAVKGLYETVLPAIPKKMITQIKREFNSKMGAVVLKLVMNILLK